MKGKNIFTSEVIEAIRKLIVEKNSVDLSRQKTIRAKIRDLGFYYSDFSSAKEGYTVHDFEGLIRSGQIKVINAKETKVAPTSHRKFAPLQEEKTNAEMNVSETASQDLPSILNLFRSNRFDPNSDNHTIVPNAAGNYILCLRPNSEVPRCSVNATLTIFEGHEVVYTGIASKSLRDRDYKQHFHGNNAGRSTLRKSLGVLFGYKQIPRDSDPSTGKTKFSLSDEAALTEWMCSNLVMYYLLNNKSNSIETHLINHFNPPLNLKGNFNAINKEYRQMLSQKRAAKF